MTKTDESVKELFTNLDKIPEPTLREVPNRNIWKTIEIGGASVEKLKEEIEKNMYLSSWASDILSKTKVGKKRKVDLVNMSVEELGFPRGAEFKDIYEAAKNQGLDLCPAEVGPQLRLQYTDQPSGEWLVIAMEPIKDSGGVLDLFYVRHYDSARWLAACYGYPYSRWGAGYRFVFVRRK